MRHRRYEWKEMLVHQSEASECGPACLAMVVRAHGGAVDMNGMRVRFGTSLRGTGLRDIMRMANEIGFAARAVRLEVKDLRHLKLPAILHWDMNHFVVLARINSRRAEVYDPARGKREFSFRELSNHFTGVALELTPVRDFSNLNMQNKLRLTDLWSKMTGWKRATVQLVTVSIIIQMIGLCLPLFLQLTVDEAVSRLDNNFLLILALGFGSLYIINAIAEGLRAYVILMLGQSASFQMIGNVFRHLLHLPTDFFEKRHMGDIVSRLGSVRSIQRVLTQSVVAALIDGIMLIITALFIFIYAWQLALVVVASVLLYLEAFA